MRPGNLFAPLLLATFPLATNPIGKNSDRSVVSPDPGGRRSFLPISQIRSSCKGATQNFLSLKLLNKTKRYSSFSIKLGTNPSSSHHSQVSKASKAWTFRPNRPSRKPRHRTSFPCRFCPRAVQNHIVNTNPTCDCAEDKLTSQCPASTRRQKLPRTRL